MLGVSGARGPYSRPRAPLLITASSCPRASGLFCSLNWASGAPVLCGEARFRSGSRSAARGGRRWDKLLAVWSGAALGGVLVHFLLWPWRRNNLGIPVLTEAEGIRSSRVPAYNMILRVWFVASALSICRDISPRDRKWALVGLATLPLMRRSAKHHFSWLVQQAGTNPAWWNRGLREAGGVVVTLSMLADAG